METSIKRQTAVLILYLVVLMGSGFYMGHAVAAIWEQFFINPHDMFHIINLTFMLVAFALVESFSQSIRRSIRLAVSLSNKTA